MPLLINGRYLTRPVTGVERYSDMLVQVVAREWPDSRVAVPGNWAGAVDIHGLEVIRVGRTSGHVWEQVQLPTVLGKGDILLSPANSGPLRVRRQVVVVHDLAVIHHPEWFDRRFVAWYSFLLPRLSRRAATVISVSHNSGTDIHQTYSLPTDRLHVVHPFVGPPRSATTDHGIGAPFYLMVASQDPRKGYDRALEWYRSLSDPAAKLVIVGRERPAFNTPPSLDLGGVILLSDVDDERLSALYCGAIALLQPSRYEGFGLPILEALQHGCPVVASDLPVFRALFGDALLYDEIGANRTMIAPMNTVMDPIERARMIASGRRCAAAFSLERTTMELHDALDPSLNS